MKGVKEVLRGIKDSVLTYVFVVLFAYLQCGGIALASDKGATHLAIAVFFPPYAWYNAVEIIWTGYNPKPVEDIVYITSSGEKYHRENCRYLKSKIPIELSEAKAKGYLPCKVCRPPRE